MRVVVSAMKGNLDAPMAPNFARSPYYLVVEVQTLQCEAVANEFATASSNAGPGAVGVIVSTGARAVLTRMIGPNAFVALEAAGIAVFSVPEGTVRSALQSYRAAHLLPLSAPNVAPQVPFGQPRAVQAHRPAHGSTWSQLQPGTQDDLESLRARARWLQDELEQVNHRIQDLEKGIGQPGVHSPRQRQVSNTPACPSPPTRAWQPPPLPDAS